MKWPQTLLICLVFMCSAAAVCVTVDSSSGKLAEGLDQLDGELKQLNVSLEKIAP